jgi:hypothetical protein
MTFHLHCAPNEDGPEPFLTIKDAAKRLGLPVFKLQRAARAGLFPTYRFQNSRILVRLSEVVARIEATRIGIARA